MDIYKVQSWGPAVGIGVTQSKHLHLAAIGKTNNPQSPYYVVNELVAAEIGRRLRLPVPPNCVVQNDEGIPFFASLNFNLTGDSLPPIIPERFRDTFKECCADVIVFDAYICNGDRHTRNMSADYSHPARYSLFDHSPALLGSGNSVIARLDTVNKSLGIGGHCLTGMVTDDRHFDRILKRVEGLEEYFIRDVVEGSEEYGINPDEIKRFVEFLLERQPKVRKLLSEQKKIFTGVKQWSLL